MKAAERLVVVSNRLPITVQSDGGRQHCQPSDGGLVSALLPIVQARGGCWVGWTGTDESRGLAENIRTWASAQNYLFEPVFLTPEEKAYFYQGCANEIIWPLFHGFQSRCNFASVYWTGYCRVHEKFADAVQQASETGDFIWIHDYHLMMLAQVLRSRGVQNRLAYFHHIPFPAPYVFEALPRRTDLLRALMHYEVIGFQTDRDRQNFIACLRHCLTNVHVKRCGERLLVRVGAQETLVGVNPISIDFDGFATVPVQSIHERFSKTQIILGVDRLDYTKGIPERLCAFETLLERHPELRGRVTMMQVVVPSREDIPEYAQLKLRIETAVSRINGEYGGPGWVPVQYFHRRISRNDLVGLYRAASIAAVTPLRDGMNLVAKEFCASRTDDRGVLVLSEFAGAAAELKPGALLVNPNDAEDVASALYEALQMGEPEECRRMKIMRAQIREHDIFHWARSFQAESMVYNQLHVHEDPGCEQGRNRSARDSRLSRDGHSHSCDLLESGPRFAAR